MAKKKNKCSVIKCRYRLWMRRNHNLSAWILATAFWNDGGVWVDTDVWID